MTTEVRDHWEHLVERHTGDDPFNPHREDGPALVWDDGTTEWYLNGRHHRVGGPAIEESDGHTVWCVDGEMHRLDGPAITWPDGSTEWYRDGLLHRTDGPAVVWADGSVEYWVHDTRVAAPLALKLLSSGLLKWGDWDQEGAARLIDAGVPVELANRMVAEGMAVDAIIAATVRLDDRR